MKVEFKCKRCKTTTVHHNLKKGEKPFCMVCDPPYTGLKPRKQRFDQFSFQESTGDG